MLNKLPLHLMNSPLGRQSNCQVFFLSSDILVLVLMKLFINHEDLLLHLFLCFSPHCLVCFEVEYFLFIGKLFIAVQWNFLSFQYLKCEMF